MVVILQLKYYHNTASIGGFAKLWNFFLMRLTYTEPIELGLCLGALKVFDT